MGWKQICLDTTMENFNKEDIVLFIDSLYDKYDELEMRELLLNCYLRIMREEKLSKLLDGKGSK